VSVHELVSYDRAESLERFDGEEEFFRELVQIFLDDCPMQMLALRAALADGDLADVTRAAHTVKGSSSNFAAKAVIAAAQRLEYHAQNGDLGAARALLGHLEREVDRLTTALRAELLG